MSPFNVFVIGVGHETDPGYELLTTDPELAQTDARNSGRVWSIWNVYMSRMGPRLVDGLVELNMLIYLVQKS